MNNLLILIAILSFATAASAENRSRVVQMGSGNMQSTIQSGQNTAMVGQVGRDNSANVTQTGNNNSAAVAQIGTGHQRTVVQEGDRLGYGSIQANSHLTGSFSRTGGNAFTSTTAQLDVGPPPSEPEPDAAIEADE